MKKAYSLTALITLACLLPAPLLAQKPDEAAPAPKAAPAKPAPEAPKLLKPSDLKWNDNLQWVSVVIDEGGVQPVRDYFGAVTKADLEALLNGTAKGMIRIQQPFYFNEAARSFTRFDMPLPGATVALYQGNGYFRHDSFKRIVPLNRGFVESLALTGFLRVEGMP